MHKSNAKSASEIGRVNKPKTKNLPFCTFIGDKLASCP